MRKGENIRKRKDKRWEGRYKLELQENGTYKYASIYGKTYKEVKERLLLAKQSCRKTKQGEMRFDDVLALWMQEVKMRVKGSTAVKYKTLIEKHISPRLGESKISFLSAAKINEFLYEKLYRNGADGLAPSYVKTMAIVIQSAFNFAVCEGYREPLKGKIFKPQSVKKEIRILSIEAQRKFENYLTDDPDETKIGIFIALHTGLRIGEICALTWQDIDFDFKVLHVRHTLSRVSNGDATSVVIETPKTKSSVRDIPICASLMPLLRYMREKSVSQYVISNCNHFVSTRTFEYRYKKILAACGMPVLNFHALRHTFATRCIEVGMDAKSLSEILGHSSVSTTLGIYVHSSMETKRIQIEKLNISPIL